MSTDINDFIPSLSVFLAKDDCFPISLTTVLSDEVFFETHNSMSSTEHGATAAAAATASPRAVGGCCFGASKRCIASRLAGRPAVVAGWLRGLLAST